MFSFTSKLKRLPFFLTTLAVTLIFCIVCISIFYLPSLIAGYGISTFYLPSFIAGYVTNSLEATELLFENFGTWTPYLITFMVTVVVLPLVETVAIIRRVNDITDGRLFVSVLVAALFVFLIWNSLYGYSFELYICGFIAVCAVLFFVPSNLIKKS